VNESIEQVKSLRRRVNVSISTRGVLTWDTTVDGVGYTREEILAESDAQVQAMKAILPSSRGRDWRRNRQGTVRRRVGRHDAQEPPVIVQGLPPGD
jgi:hypothetical protein